MAILACYSDTESGRAAIRRGLAEAHKSQDSLLVANLEKGQVTEDQLGIDLNTLMDFGVPVQILPPNPMVHDGADFVLQAEQEHEVSMIVLGLRKRSRVGKLLMGSIAQRILIEAGCPVLAVKS
ncbi:universal stress protein [Arthrobacter sp. MYb213]|uniref:universal stress protein n=1 Tax=Arthrobacter sp. MYb213 TaxID=1848595 RepID=UPI000CFAFFCA|nr:universal stress protein [Arthrobacter sp. MYb213]PRB70305.1 universal stress protein UspA [Arthrobacter sp. MYb213]